MITSSKQPTLLTIGYEGLDLPQFMKYLTWHKVEVLVDVRSSPYSRYASHFNKGAIEGALLRRTIKYLFLGDCLGGRAEGEQFYDEQGHVLYDRVADSPAFCRGIDRLLQGAATFRIALTCGEEDPTECHRRLLIGRVLGGRGVEVIHIRGDGRLQSETQLAEEEEFRKTGGQLTLFDLQETDQWKSTQSVLPKSPPESSSHSLGRPARGD